MSSETSNEIENTGLSRRELNAKLMTTIEAVKAATNRPYLTAIMGNDIRICDWTASQYYHGTIRHTYAKFGPDEVESAIKYVEGMKPLGENWSRSEL